MAEMRALIWARSRSARKAVFQIQRHCGTQRPEQAPTFSEDVGWLCHTLRWRRICAAPLLRSRYVLNADQARFTNRRDLRRAQNFS